MQHHWGHYEGKVINLRPLGKAFHIKDIIKGRYYYPKESGSVDLSSGSFA